MRPLLLPAGLRDLLPAEAHARRTLARLVLEHVALYGYEVVMPPAFELAAVLERGLGTLDPSDVIRFVEPESGEVAALRPDMTPQIARMVATRMQGLVPPLRLAYEGTVLRRRQGRARKHRQIPQAGLELLGVAGPAGDLEILTVAAACVKRAGVEAFVLDLGHADIVRSLLEPYPAAKAELLLEALSVKDAGRVASLAADDAVPEAIRAAVTRLPHLHGDASVLDDAAPLLAPTPAAPALAALRAIVEGARTRGLGAVLRLDLGEARGFAYYTGMLFRLFAEGPGEAIGGGGRYDDLLARFDAPMPAAGFALDLDNLAWALKVARPTGVADGAPLRVAIRAGDGADAVADALRTRGIPAGIAPHDRAREHALAFRYSALLSHEDEGWVLERLDTGTRTCHAEAGARDLTVAAWAESVVRPAT